MFSWSHVIRCLSLSPMINTICIARYTRPYVHMRKYSKKCFVIAFDSNARRGRIQERGVYHMIGGGQIKYMSLCSKCNIMAPTNILYHLYPHTLFHFTPALPY